MYHPVDITMTNYLTPNPVQNINNRLRRYRVLLTLQILISFARALERLKTVPQALKNVFQVTRNKSSLKCPTSLCQIPNVFLELLN